MKKVFLVKTVLFLVQEMSSICVFKFEMRRRIFRHLATRNLGNPWMKILKEALEFVFTRNFVSFGRISFKIFFHSLPGVFPGNFMGYFWDLIDDFMALFLGLSGRHSEEFFRFKRKTEIILSNENT